jgi:predicted alpha/beta superfamily hydrolase
MTEPATIKTQSPGERLQGLVPSEPTLRSRFFTVESPRTMRATGFEWDHELRVALPSTYADTDRSYPVLWITDNELEPALSVLGDAQLILVGVGSDRVPLKEHSRRRTFDFYPAADHLVYDTPGSDYLRRELGKFLPGADKTVGGGARRFLDFLVDEARPALAADYRMDPDDHALHGFSAGGTFVAHTLFTRPDAFARYICGSGALYNCGGFVFELEKQYAAEHDDLPATIFFACGEAEVTDPLINAFHCASSTMLLAEILSVRGYPSLNMSVKMFPGESHQSLLPQLLRWGVRSIWGDTIFAPPA